MASLPGEIYKWKFSGMCYSPQHCLWCRDTVTAQLLPGPDPASLPILPQMHLRSHIQEGSVVAIYSWKIHYAFVHSFIHLLTYREVIY